jgi:predicted CopG family antitoxin
MCQNCRIVTLARKLVASSDAFDELVDIKNQPKDSYSERLWNARQKQNESIKLLEQEFKKEEINNVE